MEIRTFTKADWPAVQQIYKEGLDTKMATFETEVPDYTNWDKRFLDQCRFLAVERGEVLGWVALSAISKRKVYRGVAELSLYIAAAHRGKGIGKQLLNWLIEASEAEGFWTLQATIFAENEVSIKMHQKAGFNVVGRRNRIAQLHGIWKDNILMERRSSLF